MVFSQTFVFSLTRKCVYAVLSLHVECSHIILYLLILVTVVFVLSSFYFQTFEHPSDFDFS